LGFKKSFMINIKTNKYLVNKEIDILDYS